MEYLQQDIRVWVCQSNQELLDIVPTLTEIVDEPMAWTQGKSLWPIISGQQKPDHHHDFVRCEFYDVLDFLYEQA